MQSILEKQIFDISNIVCISPHLQVGHNEMHRRREVSHF
jgi:hypothetical protein